MAQNGTRVVRSKGGGYTKNQERKLVQRQEAGQLAFDRFRVLFINLLTGNFSFLSGPQKKK